MCTVLLAPGGNPIAVNKYIDININIKICTFDLDEDTQSFKTVSFKFHRLFNMPPEEKLVNYYSCRYVSVDKSAA
jgi:hypothetical protein